MAVTCLDIVRVGYENIDMFKTKIFNSCILLAVISWGVGANASETNRENQLMAALDSKDGVLMIHENDTEEKMVICGRALITMLKGSKINVVCSSDASVVSMLEGTFHVHVGGELLMLELGNVKIQAQKSEMVMSRIKSQWIVQAKNLSESGSVELIIPQVQSVETQDASAPISTENVTAPEPKSKNLVLKSGLRWRLKNQREVKRANPLESKIFGGRIKALFPEPSSALSAPLLSAVSIEQESDFLVTTMASDAAAMNEIEIEDVEVEVGCVEICVD